MTADRQPRWRELSGVALVSAALLTTELALTRIFSVVMYYHFAFLAISIALFGLSASGVFAYVFRGRLDRWPTNPLLAWQAIVYAVATLVALFMLVRLRVGLNYSPANLGLMLAIYALAALPFFTGGLVITIAISRMARRINAVYASDLGGAAIGCLVLIPLLDRFGAPGVVLMAAALALVASLLFAPRDRRPRVALAGLTIASVILAGHVSGVSSFGVTDTKGHQGDLILFSKWNSFSRVAVYERSHGDWSLSSAYSGPLPETRFMDIDSAASTPIIGADATLGNVQYLRYELTAFAYRLMARDLEPPTGDTDGDGSISESDSNPQSRIPNPGFTALVIGPGGGRDLLSALVFGARHVDGVEINSIIANDVMRGRFSKFSGGIYTHPRVTVVVDDGRSFVRRSSDRYDVIQASLVDTWAATAAGAYTLTENTLYTVEAFNDYLDHLSDGGILTITRWEFDGLRLVSLAQAACESRGWDAAPRLAIVRLGRVATFLLKRSPLTVEEIRQLRTAADQLGFEVLYAPGNSTPDNNDYAKLIHARDRQLFYASYSKDVRPTTDDRPFFFHTTKLKDQFQVAFGRSMLFGNGLSALLTLMGISTVLVLLFVIGPLVLVGPAPTRGWLAWIAYFGALGAGFMLIEVSLLQRFVLLLGHPVYSLTVTLFSLLLGTAAGAAWSRRIGASELRKSAAAALLIVATIALGVASTAPPILAWAIPFTRGVRLALAIASILPIGLVLGVPMPTGIRLLAVRAPEMVSWAWGINGALSVVGATSAVFVAMNWGFRVTLWAAGAVYLVAAASLVVATASGSQARRSL
jgi:spermidine synthase